MKQSYIKLVGIGWLISILLPSLVVADEAELAAIEARVQRLGLEVISVSESPISGFRQIITNQGLLYITPDGERLLAGQLFDISGSNVQNLTELAMADVRRAALADVTNEMIVYPAPQERHRITVFTDHTCGYCQTLHRNLEDYHQAGITVQYLAYPRGGMSTEAARDLNRVWCADDQQQALDLAKMGETPDAGECAVDITRHYQLGQQFGVTGTPAIVLADGRLLAGYRPAAALLQAINQ